MILWDDVTFLYGLYDWQEDQWIAPLTNCLAKAVYIEKIRGCERIKKIWVAKLGDFREQL